MGSIITNEGEDGFDLDSIFTDGGSAPVGADDTPFECEKPHWSISRKDLIKVLQIIASFPSKSTVYMAMWTDGDFIHVHANNRDAFIDASFPLLNKGNYYKTDRVYFLDSSKLLAFVSSYAQFAFSFYEDSSVNYESPYACIQLDTIKASLDDVRIKAFHDKDSDGWKEFPLTRNEIGVLKNLYNFAVKLSDSKVLMDADKSEAFYTLYKYTVLRKTGLAENVVIRRLDLPTIHEIAEDGLEFIATKDRLYFKFRLGVVSFLRVPYDESSFMYPASFCTGKEVGKFSLDIPIIKKALKLCSLFSAEGVEFVSEGSDIFMAVSGKAMFKVGSGSLASPFELSLDTFSKLLGTVPDNGDSAEVTVSDHGVDFTLGSSVYSMSRVSVSQIKSKDFSMLGTQTSQTVTGASKPVKQETVLAEGFEDKDIL